MRQGMPRRIAKINIMKTLFLAAVVFLGVSIFVPQADAGGYRERHSGYYDYGRPVYRDDCSYSRPRYSYYRRPIRTSYRSYEYCEPRVRYYSRPRFSFHIGF